MEVDISEPIRQAAQSLGGAGLSHILSVDFFADLITIIAPASGHAVAGPAFPITIDPGDLSGLAHAMHDAMPGSVIFVVPGRPEPKALIGGLSMLEARRAGHVALVVAGYVCDLPELRAAGVPLAALGVVPAAASLGSLEGNYQIGAQHNDRLIEQGDLLVIDEDGVVSLGKNPQLTELPKMAAKLLEREAALKGNLASGRTLWELIQEMKLGREKNNAG